MSLPQRILVIRLSAMGDVAMCIPVLLALKRDYPGVEIIALSRKRYHSIFNQIAGITFIEADVEGAHKGVSGIYKLSRQLKALKIDAVADVHNVLRTKLLKAFITGIPKATIDKGRAEKKKLITDPDFFQPLKHNTQRYADVFGKLGFNIKLQGNEFLPKPVISPDLQKKFGSGDTVRIGFAPFAAHLTKAITIEKAKEIVHALQQLEHTTIILIGGGKKETEQLNELASPFLNVVNLAGTTDFKNELAVIGHLNVMIAMDSGNGHLAALYGVPVVTLWGNTHPHAGFAPYAQPDSNQLTPCREQFPLIPTSIYGNKKVAGYEQVTDSIDTQTVIRLLKQLI